VEKHEDARISDDMNQRKLATSAPFSSSRTGEADKPRKALNLVISLVLGAVLGLGFASFRN